MAKIKIRIDDPETRAVWKAALAALDEIAAWPSWKRGEPLTDERPGGPSR